MILDEGPLPFVRAVSSCATMNLQIKLAFSVVLSSVALAASGCGGVPAKSQPTDPAGNFKEVSTGIYRGGRPDQAGVEVDLPNLGVKTIIDLENDDQAIALERSWAQQAGINFISKPMNGMDSPNDGEVNDILAKIRTEQPVYVHCMQGHDRTGLVIALYRVFYEGWSPKAAHDEMMADGYNSLLIAMNHYFEEKTHWED
jgi:protein tyrosine/serine phosphatase